MSKSFRTFPADPELETLAYGEGCHLITASGRKILDLTAGITGHAVYGWGNRRIVEAINSQLLRIGHIDYKTYLDANREALAEALLSNNISGLNRVFYSGGSGAEACESAIHLSYQVHYEQGKRNKSWIISRTQSYHGSSTECMSIGERPNLEFYRPLFPERRAKCKEHNMYRHMIPSETEEEYSARCARELETLILDLGPDNVASFVAETMMGGLVGDVPAAQGYWQMISSVCKKYDVHLIMDEVWCGGGVTGKKLCVDWENICPDFVFMGKTLAGGYLPISLVATNSEFEDIIRRGSGRVENSCTFQGHSACVAAALACNEILDEPGFLDSVVSKGKYIRKMLRDSLSDEEFFANVRGRGVRNSLEYHCDDKHLFGIAVANHLYDSSNILLSGKWHRFCFSHAMTINQNDIDFFLNEFCKAFRLISRSWSKEFRKTVQKKNYF